MEGDSAAGAVAGVRSVQYQAVLPMQGKPLNALKAKATKVHANPLFSQLSIALGVPMIDAVKAASTQIDPTQDDPTQDDPTQYHPTQVVASQATATEPGTGLFPTLWSEQLANLRFARINLLFDPDADGIHCGALMLMFFWRWMRPLLASGRIHMIRAPLFEMTAHLPDGEILLAHPDSVVQCNSVKALWLDMNAAQIKIHHYRGLGSINADVLARTCVDPASRQSTGIGLATAQSAIGAFSPKASLRI